MKRKSVARRLLTSSSVAAALVSLFAWPVAGEEPTYPPPPEATSQASAPASVVEQAPVGPQDPLAFVPFDGSPEEGTLDPAVEIDMSQIPATPELLESDERGRVHIQGQLEQYDAPADGSGSRTPLGNTEHDTPEAEMNYSEPQTADPYAPAAPGDYVRGFDARGYSGWFPPDTQMAAGPVYLVEALNSGFMVYSKTGVLTRSYTNFESFVHLPLGWGGFCYDPRVVFNRETNQFVMTVMGKDDTALKSYVWVLISQTDNPNGSWWMYRIDTSYGTAGNEEWLDYASLGVDHWGVYFVGNSFGFPGVSAFQSRLWSFSPAMLTGAGAGTYRWNDLRWPNGDRAASLQVAHPHTQNAGGNTFLVNTYSSSGNQICLWQLHGDRYSGDPQGIATTLTRATIASKTYYSMGNNVDQADSATDIDAGDTRVMNAVYSQGKVYGTLTLNWDNARAYSEIYVFALYSGNSTMAWDYALWNSSSNMFYPSITVEGSDGTPNWFIAASMTQPASSGDAGYAGAMSFTRDVSGGANVWRWEKYGTDPYVRLDSNGRNRWGDYSGAAYDWTCKNVWGAAEYAAGTSTWGTRIFGRTIDDEAPCTYLRVNDPNGGGSYTAGTTKTITWDRLNLPSGEDLYLRFLDDGGIVQTFGPLPTSTASYAWPVPNTPTALGKFFVGTWSGSTWTNLDYSDNNFTVVGLPDLTRSVFSPPASAVQGQSFSQYHSARNDGAVTAGSFIVQLRISTNSVCSVADTLLASRTVASLPPSSFSGASPTITIPPGQMLGTNYLCLMIDTGGTVTEFVETNNIFAEAINILPVLIFADGFERGSTSAWSSTIP
ncbi:MAG: CARDB domain-containing protein [Acidobacteriota bacterium]|nr:CARDB domain-containing protein [Acidobacteriota bacterium]